ncbi:MAG: hypothetical protein ACI853_000051, partial [Paracoccaceae bacterium]
FMFPILKEVPARLVCSFQMPEIWPTIQSPFPRVR